MTRELEAEPFGYVELQHRELSLGGRWRNDPSGVWIRSWSVPHYHGKEPGGPSWIRLDSVPNRVPLTGCV
jgi:hypothetical protein